MDSTIVLVVVYACIIIAAVIYLARNFSSVDTNGVLNSIMSPEQFKPSRSPLSPSQRIIPSPPRVKSPTKRPLAKPASASVKS